MSSGSTTSSIIDDLRPLVLWLLMDLTTINGLRRYRFGTPCSGKFPAVCEPNTRIDGNLTVCKSECLNRSGIDITFGCIFLPHDQSGIHTPKRQRFSYRCCLQPNSANVEIFKTELPHSCNENSCRIIQVVFHKFEPGIGETTDLHSHVRPHIA